MGDKGYISKSLTQNLLEGGLQLITPIKKNRHNKLMPLLDKIILRKRALIETVNDLLKNSGNIDHTRHRNVINFRVNLVATLIAYTFREKLPTINFSAKDRELLNETC